MYTHTELLTVFINIQFHYPNSVDTQLSTGLLLNTSLCVLYWISWWNSSSSCVYYMSDVYRWISLVKYVPQKSLWRTYSLYSTWLLLTLTILVNTNGQIHNLTEQSLLSCKSCLKYSTITTYNRYHGGTHKFVESDVNAVQKLKVSLVMVV